MQIKSTFWHSESSLFYKGNLSVSGPKTQQAVATTSKPRMVKLTTSLPDEARRTPKTFKAPLADVSDKQFRAEAKLSKFFDRSHMEVYSGKSDDELLAMAVNSVNHQKIQHAMSVGNGAVGYSAFDGKYVRSGSPTSVITGAAGMTEAELVAEARTAVTNQGLDLTFDESSVRAEVSRAIQVGGSRFLSYSTDPSSLNFDLQLENLAANYAYYTQKAEESYSGEQLEATMKMLETEFAKGLETVISRFTEEGSARYMQADMGGITQSLKTLYGDFVGYYSDLIRDEQFDAGISEENAWLDNCAVYIVGKLRNYADSRDDVVSSDAKYDINDLQAMSIMSKLSTVDTRSSVTLEEKLGIELGMDAIKLKMLEAGDISDACKAQLQESFDMLKIEVISNAKEQLKIQSQDYYRLRDYSYDNFDEDVVDKTIQTMLTALDSDNLYSGIKSAISQILESFQSRQAAQYESGIVQERCKVPEEATVEHWTSQGNSSEQIKLLGMKISQAKPISDRNVLAFDALARLFDKEAWAVPYGEYSSADILI